MRSEAKVVDRYTEEESFNLPSHGAGNLKRALWSEKSRGERKRAGQVERVATGRWKGNVIHQSGNRERQKASLLIIIIIIWLARLGESIAATRVYFVKRRALGAL